MAALFNYVAPCPDDVFHDLFQALCLQVPNQEQYLDPFFPSKLRTDSFVLNGKEWSVKNSWSAKSTRSKILNGRFQYEGTSTDRTTGKLKGNQLYKTLPSIFSADPTLWSEALRQCDELVQRTAKPEDLRSVLSSAVAEMRGENWTRFHDSCDFSEFRSFLTKQIAERPGAAIPVLVLTVLMGNVPNQDLFQRIQASLPSNEELAAVAAYLEACGRQVRHSVWPTPNTPPLPTDFAAILDRYTDGYDGLYRCFTHVTDSSGKVLFEPSADGASAEGRPLLDLLYDRSILRGGSLLLTGAPGTEKHGLLHILFLRLASDVLSGYQDGFAPYLCNLWYYSALPKNDALKLLKDDFSKFSGFCKAHPNRRPVVFIDGVREYSIKGDQQLDMVVNNLLTGLKKPILLVDTERLRERIRRNDRNPAPFTRKDGFSLFADLTAVSLDEEEPALAYLEAYQRVFPSDDGKKAEEIIAALRALLLLRIDTGQLRRLREDIFADGNEVRHSRKENKGMPSSARLLGLYRRVCERTLYDDDLRDRAMEWAFSFCFCPDNRQIPLEDDFREAQLFLCSHETILNYYSANFYLKLLRSDDDKLRFKFLGKDGSGAPLDALNVVMPRSVTLFLVPLMNNTENAGTELYKQISRRVGPMLTSLADGQYSFDSPKPFSQMLYLLGRIDNLDAAADLLKQTYVELRKSFHRFPKNDPARGREYRNLLYLLRSASIGLIAKDVSTVTEPNGSAYDVWDDYLFLLLTDPSANELNRAFHLEYYEDRSADPEEDLMGDDVHIGVQTLDSLLSATATASMGKALVRTNRFYKLNLFTLASLLQARIEHGESAVRDSLEACVRETLRRIDWLQNTLPEKIKDDRLFLDYLNMVREDFNAWLDHSGRLDPASVRFFSFFEGRGLRRNWIEDGDAKKTASDGAAQTDGKFSETIADHELQDWLIAMLLLPEHYVPENAAQYTRNAVYDKESILKLLLIHDAVEVSLGNRARFEKTMETRAKERSEMTRWLLRCTYPSLANGSLHKYLRAWLAWTSYDGDDSLNGRRVYRDVNGDVAHQIDRIQELYQLLRNVSSGFAIEPKKLCEWVRANDRQIKAAPCREIARVLILRDPKLKKVLDDYSLTLDLE